MILANYCYVALTWLRRQPLVAAFAWGFAATLALLMYVHVQNLYRIQSIRTAALSVQSALIDIETEQRGFLLSGAKDSATIGAIYLDGYRTSRTYLVIRMLTLCRKIPHTPVNVRLCHELDSLVHIKLEEMENTVRLAEAGHLDQSLTIFSTNRGEHLKRQILKTLDQIRFAQADESFPQRLTSCLVPY